jgi:hypothetical protein
MQQFSFEPFRGGEAVTEYSVRYRHPDLARFDVGSPVDLHPSRPRLASAPEVPPQDSWPFHDRAGVYLMYDDALELFYIGKASMSRCLGQRLYEYFGGGEVCVPKFEWLHPARFLIIIAMPKESPFEAPALEEFLIRRLHPRINGTGRGPAYTS